MKFDGYLHTNGEVIVKRFFNESSIEIESPFVVEYFPPIEANDIKDAKIKMILSLRFN